MHNKINNKYINNVQYCCRVPQGTCGLKSSGARNIAIRASRVPQGTCGLKSLCPRIAVIGLDVGSRKGPVD